MFFRSFAFDLLGKRKINIGHITLNLNKDKVPAEITCSSIPCYVIAIKAMIIMQNKQEKRSQKDEKREDYISK